MDDLVILRRKLEKLYCVKMMDKLHIPFATIVGSSTFAAALARETIFIRA